MNKKMCGLTCGAKKTYPISTFKSGCWVSVWCYKARYLLMSLAMGVFLFPNTSLSQSLDEAVDAQLAFSAFPCRVLLDNDLDNKSFLSGELLNICNRSNPSGGSPSSASTNGGTATPTTAPRIVQLRLQEGSKKSPSERKPGSDGKVTLLTAGASADASIQYPSGLGLFISGQNESLDRDVTTFEGGYDSDTWRITAGGDYRVPQHLLATHIVQALILGLAFDYSHQDGDFESGGSFENSSYGSFAFAALHFAKPFYVQGTLGYTNKQFERQRQATFTELNTNGSVNFPSVAGSQNSDYSADQFQGSILAGYKIPVLGQGIISPRVGIEFFHVNYDTYSESGPTGLELTFHDDSQTSLQTRVGAQAFMSIPTSVGDVIPSTSVDWMYEAENDQRTVEVSFVGDSRAQRFTYKTESPDRNFFEFNAGLSVVLLNGIQPFINYRGLVGHSFFTSHAGTFGIRVPLASL